MRGLVARPLASLVLVLPALWFSCALAAGASCDAGQSVELSGRTLRQAIAYDASGAAQPCAWSLRGSYKATLYLEGLDLGDAELAVYDGPALDVGGRQAVITLSGSAGNVGPLRGSGKGFLLVLRPGSGSVAPALAIFQSGVFVCRASPSR